MKQPYMRSAYEEPPTTKPTACPYCHSRAVGTLAREVTESTCWRCQACGESWTNAQAAARRDIMRRG
jgi:transposase-like protein